MRQVVAAISTLALLVTIGSAAAAPSNLDTARIDELTGLKGKLDEKEQVYKVSAPRSDLKVISRTVRITPPMGLTSWAAFAGARSHTIVMGDMATIQRRLPELHDVPTLLVWAPEDNVFPIEYANRLKELLPRAEGPLLFDRAGHFLQDDRGPEIVAAVVPFLQRSAGNRP